MSPAALHPRTAFTLVELLVVLGIFAVLVGFLVPTVNAVRAGAKQVACASNLRQIGIAMAAYAARENVLPFAMINDESPLEGHPDSYVVSRSVTWDDLLNADIGGGLRPEDLIEAFSRQPCAVLLCPADSGPQVFGSAFRISCAMPTIEPAGAPPARPGEPPFLGTGGEGVASVNGGLTVPARLSIRPAEVRDASGTFAVVEFPSEFNAQGYSASIHHAWSYDYAHDDHQGRSLHRSRFNCLYHDGHVDAVAEAETLGTGTAEAPRGRWTRDPND